MKTLEILLSAAKREATLKVWSLAQIAYCNNRISMSDLGKVQNQLRETNPNFFIPKSMQ